MNSPIDTRLKSFLSWMPYSAILPGGTLMTAQWFRAKYQRRGKMEYSIAITAVLNQILN